MRGYTNTMSGSLTYDYGPKSDMAGLLGLMTLYFSSSECPRVHVVGKGERMPRLVYTHLGGKLLSVGDDTGI